MMASMSRGLGVAVMGFVVICAMSPAFGDSNIVKNGSFEEWTGGQPAAWFLEGDKGVTQQLEEDSGVTSGRAAKLTCSAFDRETRYSWATLSQRGCAGLEEGKWYLFSCWARQENMGPAMATVELFADESVKIPYEKTLLFHQLPLRNEWRYFERYFQATSAGTDKGRLTIYFDSTGSMWLDDVIIQEVPTPEPTVGAQLPEIGAKNLVPNGSFECGTGNWSSLGKNITFVAGLTTLFGEVETGAGFDGDRTLRIELSPDTTWVASFNWPSGVAEAQNAPLAANIGWIPVQKDAPYTLSASMRADRENVPARIQICFKSAFGNAGRPSQDVVLGTEWKRYSFTVNAPAQYAFVTVGPDLSKSDLDTATVWIDAIQLEAGSEASEYAPREPVEISANAASKDHIYDVNSPVAITLGGRNATNAPVVVDVSVRVTDYFDVEVLNQHVAVSIPADATIGVEHPLALNQPGFYRAHLAWDANGRAHAQEVPFAVIQPYAQKDSAFGVNHAPSTNDLCMVLRRAGVTWMREWVMNWDALEPEPGKFDFKGADTHVNRVLSNDLNMVQQLPPFPSTRWNTTAPAGAEEIAPDLPWDLQFYAPESSDMLKNYILATVAHFKDRIRVWEYLNEPLYTIHSLPNVEQMDATVPGMPGANYTVKDYLGLLEVFNASVKEADPGAVTIGGLGARPDLLSKEYFDAKGLTFSDHFNLHIYPGKRVPEGYIPQMQLLQREMAAAGPTKSIWMTEYSYFGIDELPVDPYIIGPGPWAANRLLRDEKECADYSIRYAAIMFAHGVEKIFYHGGHSMSTEVNESWGETESALTGFGGVPNKLYAAQSAMANILGPKFTAAGALAPPEGSGVYGYAFQTPEHAVVIMWAPAMETKGRTYSAQFPQGASALNIVGAPTGSAQIALSDSPVYIIDTSRPADALLQAMAVSESKV